MQLLQGDCLELMPSIPDGSIDMVLADPPYGTTQCKWDSVIPLEQMWGQLKRIIKRNGAIVMTASQPFTTTLIASNIEQFKYSWIWDKALATGHLNAEIQPLRISEDVPVFYSLQPTYNPQKTYGHKRKTAHTVYEKLGDGGQVYGKESRNTRYDSTDRFPTGIITISNADRTDSVHPTQKPVKLMEYMIYTYTNEGETVLDFTMGSGTTGVACYNTGRKFIGIEKDEAYFKIASARIDNASRQQLLSI